ncbi:hypothetical protein EVAR_52318_1 [Eumeta japonica]|uniref:Uncharacterized protein n=1 Tax=Eumeta variegata TaxID=151549 RepID=A0A4C1Y6V7_EUMVA|nr:hypothetical protein EVAR_52318_1 [Eumeta japonica]
MVLINTRFFLYGRVVVYGLRLARATGVDSATVVPLSGASDTSPSREMKAFSVFSSGTSNKDFIRSTCLPLSTYRPEHVSSRNVQCQSLRKSEILETSFICSPELTARARPAGSATSPQRRHVDTGEADSRISGGSHAAVHVAGKRVKATAVAFHLKSKYKARRSDPGGRVSTDNGAPAERWLTREGYGNKTYTTTQQCI